MTEVMLRIAEPPSVVVVLWCLCEKSWSLGWCPATRHLRNGYPQENVSRVARHFDTGNTGFSGSHPGKQPEYKSVPVFRFLVEELSLPA